MAFEIIAKGGLSLDRLQTLVLLAERGSIVAAAGNDPIRQSQFSRQLSELERCFECALTERRGRTVTLTAEGRRLADMARDQLQSLDRFAKDVAGVPLTVRIGAGESVLNWLLIPTLTQGRAGQPVKWHYFNLQAEDIKTRLLDQRLDFGIIGTIGDSARLKHRQLGTLETSLFVPPGLGGREPGNVQEAVSRLPLALLDSQSRVRDAIERACRARHVAPKVFHECTTTTQIAALVTSGQAAGPLPTLARKALCNQAVKEYPLAPLLGKTKPLNLTWNPRTVATSTRMERIRDALNETLKAALAAAPVGG